MSCVYSAASCICRAGRRTLSHSFGSMIAAGKVLATALATLIVVGCASTSGSPIAIEDVRSIKVGSTTKADIMRMFGSPNTRQGTPDGRETWVYSYASTKTFMLTPSDTSGASVGVTFNGNVVSSCQYTTMNWSLGFARSNNNQTSLPCDRI